LYFQYIIILLLFSTGISFSESYAQIVYDDDFVIEKFATGLNFPTTMTFVDDELLILEKETGKVIKISENGLKFVEPVLDVAVSNGGESGLLGIESTDNHVYLYYTKACYGHGWDESSTKFSEYGSSNCNSFQFDKPHDKYSKNSLYQYDWDGEKLINPVLIKEFPADNNDHAGGIIVANGDDEIYFVIGNQNFDRPESFLMYDSGEIIDKNLKTPDYVIATILKIDNTEKNIETFATGIRNSFGLAIDPITGYLWDTENGANGWDEINLVKKGFNSGWVAQMGPSSDPLNDFDTPYVMSGDFVYSDPEFSWTQSIGVTAISFPTIDSFSKFSDSLFVGDFNNGRIYKFQLNGDRTEFIFSNPELSDLKYDWGVDEYTNQNLFAEGIRGGVVDIKFHKNDMYVVSIFDGIIYKISSKQIPSPLQQYQNDIVHQDIICKSEFIPIMSTSNGINCVKPSTALILADRQNWTLNHLEMPMIELKYQNLDGLDLKNTDLSNSDLRGTNFANANISNVNFTNANLEEVNLSKQDLSTVILSGADLTGADLSGADLSEKNLSGADLSNVILSGTNFSGADLSNIILSGADLSGADLSEKNLSGADLSNVILSGADLSNVILSGADLSGADLSNIILSGADLSGADLSDTDITNVDLIDTNIQETDFTNSVLVNINLSGKDLSNANLSNANLSGADLSNANLSNANLSNASLENANLSGADLSNANLSNANLFGANLSSSDLSRTNFSSAGLTEINFSNFNLIGTIFVGTDLTNSNLSGAKLVDVNLSSADLSRSNLMGVDFRKTILTDTTFKNTRLIGADFSNMMLSRINFENANLSNANFEESNLKKSNFKEATLNQANLFKADLSKADLTDANLQGTNLSQADLGDTYLTRADLTRADLSKTNLQTAILIDTILIKCTGHELCE